VLLVIPRGILKGKQETEKKNHFGKEIYQTFGICYKIFLKTTHTLSIFYLNFRLRQVVELKLLLIS